MAGGLTLQDLGLLVLLLLPAMLPGVLLLITLAFENNSQ